MATSPHLSAKLHDALGKDAGEELVGIVDKAASDISELRADLAEVRHEMHVGFDRVEQAITSLRSDFRADLAEVVATLSDKIAATDVRLSEKIAATDVRLAGKISATDVRLAAVKSDLMKWSFVFWVGAVGAIALLAGVLR